MLRAPAGAGGGGVLVMEDPRLTARVMLEFNDTTLDELWLWYWAYGGEAEPFEFDAYLHGLQSRDEFDLKILAWAVERVIAQ
ncbi:hypothetical protein GCM10007170_45270 [Arthrobacter liuii]|uniref:Uncharacterized protein n=2 Tax=Arthrobacter liuii TaxID=1476996 RepID=A0ABQ2B1K1_9MICC|nr:hypothetical protein GCM10007170_45270 [Arthrobacter liuii]